MVQKGLQLQPRFTSDGSPALISVNNHPSSSPSRLLDSVGSVVMNNNSLLLGQAHCLQTDTPLTPNSSISSTMSNLPGPDQNLVAVDQLVEVEDVEDTETLEGNVHRILLGNVQTIPIQIIDSPPVLSKLKSSFFFFNLYGLSSVLHYRKKTIVFYSVSI